MHSAPCSLVSPQFIYKARLREFNQSSILITTTTIDSNHSSLVNRVIFTSKSMMAIVPVRSTSLPPRPHPDFLKIETELTKLRTWELSSPSLSDSDTIQTGLIQLAELLNAVEQLIQSPQTQRAFHRRHLNHVEEALDGSVGLLDMCGTARDLLLIMQEHVQSLKSALRRRGRDSDIEANINSYVGFRKRANKDITKSFRQLKRIESKVVCSFPLSDEDDHHLSSVIRVINEANAIALSIFRSLVLFLSVHAMTTGNGKWSSIRKLILGASDREPRTFNQVQSVDITLCSILGKIQKNKDAKVDGQEAQKRLETLDGSIKCTEGKLDCLFRCLIQNRASLLNLVTP